MLSRIALIAAALLALFPVSASAAGPAWEQWVGVPGVFDLGGPRSDHTLLVAGSAALYTLDTTGTLTPFARGSGGYHEDPGAEAYLAVSPGLHVDTAACDFKKDDTFILRLHTPTGITRVFASGEASGSFANVDTPSLNGITFDTTGLFGHRLLVTGPVSGKTEIAAVDCSSAVEVITKSAPVVEGGLAVAPMTFGAFGGSLIAPDELSGVIWAIGPDGTSHQVVNSGLPKGQDIGVESVAFVPPGFSRGGHLYYSDRATSGSPHPGTDHVLRLSSTDLLAAGVQDGDLLAATEGGASMIDVRCDSACHVITVVGVPTTAHAEGHLVFTIDQPASPSPSRGATLSAAPVKGGAGGVPLMLVVVIAILAALGGAGIALMARRR